MKEEFQKNGYVVVRNVIPKDFSEIITQYALFDELQNPSKTDVQVPNSHSKYADPLMETLLLEFKEVMEENTGLKLYPTYSYYRVYRNGNDLKPHKDRPSCEISTTMCFDYSCKTSWPIYMEGNLVNLNPGDMIIYRGCDLSHWRETLICSPEEWHVQGFFHYVDVNGPFSEYKFDKRPNVGFPSVNKIKRYIQYL